MNVLKTPDFTIDTRRIVSELTALLNENRQQLATLLENPQPTWENLIVPLDDLSDKLNQFWAPISHLNAVSNTDLLRQAYNACLPLLSDYATDIGHNKQLFTANVLKRVNPSTRLIMHNKLVSTTHYATSVYPVSIYR